MARAPVTGGTSGPGVTDRSGPDGRPDGSGGVRWTVQWSEPFGENRTQRALDTEAEAGAVVEAMEERYESVGNEPGPHRVEMNAEVCFTTVGVPDGPLPDER